jgi:hypothetical protein
MVSILLIDLPFKKLCFYKNTDNGQCAKALQNQLFYISYLYKLNIIKIRVLHRSAYWEPLYLFCKK